jgi:aspartate oxidase
MIGSHRLIEELVYERVRLDADLRALIDLERELSHSFRRALVEAHARGDGEEVARTIERALERALTRVTAELVQAAEEEGDGDCPLCEAPLACPPG